MRRLHGELGNSISVKTCGFRTCAEIALSNLSSRGILFGVIKIFVVCCIKLFQPTQGKLFDNFFNRTVIQIIFHFHVFVYIMFLIDCCRFISLQFLGNSVGILEIVLTSRSGLRTDS